MKNKQNDGCRSIMRTTARFSRTSLAVGLMAFLSLFAGGCIYLLFRPAEASFLVWLERMGLRACIETIRSIALPLRGALPEWTVYSLPDGLWMFAYALVIAHIWQRRRTATGLLCMASVAAVPLVLEWLQFAHLLPGTGCPVDAGIGLLGAGIGLFCARFLSTDPVSGKNRPARWATASFLAVMTLFVVGSIDMEEVKKTTEVTEDGKTIRTFAYSGVDLGITGLRPRNESHVGTVDRYGRFQGEVQIYRNNVAREAGPVLSESGPMADGERHGLWKSYNANGSVESTDRYDHGVLIPQSTIPQSMLPQKRISLTSVLPNEPGKAASAAGSSRITRMLARYSPWVVHAMNSWGISESESDALLAFVEKFILQKQPKNRDDLISAYDDAVNAATNSLFQAARSGLIMISDVQLQAEAKNFPLRLAIFDWYLDGGGTIDRVLLKNYPDFHAKLLSYGATSAQIQAFLDELEGHLKTLGLPDRKDPLYFDVLDKRIQAALDLIDQDAHLTALGAMPVELALIYRDSNPFMQAASKAFYNLVWDFRSTPYPSLSFYSDSGTIYTLQATPELMPQAWRDVPGAGPRPGIGGPDVLTDTNIPPIGHFYRFGSSESPSAKPEVSQKLK